MRRPRNRLRRWGIISSLLPSHSRSAFHIHIPLRCLLSTMHQGSSSCAKQNCEVNPDDTLPEHGVDLRTLRLPPRRDSNKLNERGHHKHRASYEIKSCPSKRVVLLRFRGEPYAHQLCPLERATTWTISAWRYTHLPGTRRDGG